MSPCLRFNMFDHFFCAPACAVRSVGAERVPHICEGEDARGKRNVFAFQPSGITRAVPSFVMAVRDNQRRLQVVDLREHLIGIGGMSAHDHPFFIGQFSILEQNAVGYAQLADVV